MKYKRSEFYYECKAREFCVTKNFLATNFYFRCKQYFQKTSKKNENCGGKT
jgi:hypothetical protein